MIYGNTKYDYDKGDVICLSPNYFGDLIKKETGITAKDYIKKHVIEATKEALAGTSKTIKGIN